MFKKILFSLFSLFLVYQTVLLVLALRSINPPIDGTSAWIYAALINLFATGVFAFVGFVFPTHKLLPKSYYLVRQPKLIMNTYKYLGVEPFRKALMFFIWGKAKNRKHFFDGTKTGLKNFIYQSKQSEFGHILAFILVQACALIVAIKGNLLLLAITTAINVIFNLYPVILQRHHRARIQAVMARIGNKVHSREV